MKKHITIYSLFAISVAFISFSGLNHQKNIGQPPTGRTGAPGETTCAGCHSGGNFSGTTTFDWDGSSDLHYESGQTYTITFTADYGAPRYGFSMTVLNDDDEAVGSFALINNDNTSLNTANNRQYVGHKSADATNSWSFEWTAPENDAGNLTFYYVINAADNQNNTSGDYIETGSATISFSDNGDGDEDATFTVNSQKTEINVFPNPAKDVIRVVSDHNIQSLQVWDLQGRLVYSMDEAGTSYDIILADWNKGLYIIRIQNMNGMEQMKVLVE